MKSDKHLRTYRNQMAIYCFFTVTIIIVIMGIHTNLNRGLIEKYNQSYILYERLNNFYDSQSEAHDSLKNYLYTKTDEEFEHYQKQLDLAKRDIVHIQNNALAEANFWRFSLLINMIESYKEQADKVIFLMKIQDKQYSEAYDDLLGINETIFQTSDDFYRLVTVVMENTLDEIDIKKQQTEFLSITIVFICGIGILLYTFVILKSITNPIDKLVDNMDDIKAGIFDFHHIPVSSKEMKILCLALQDLSDNIYKNIAYEKEKAEFENKLLSKENESLKKDELLASSELKMLQSQINPHFLFNALNMIYQQALKDQSFLTVEMIEKMTECMRYTMNQKSRMSTLHLELNFVQNYIFIQNKRFQGRIRFELQMSDNLPNIKIPAMIIEPLIDNSIKHGLSNTEIDGLITINVTSDAEKVEIHVSDNGKGMDTDCLEVLVMNHYRNEKNQVNLGLYNLSRRLDMYFSGQASININSFEDCGFDTLIIIPIVEGR